MSEITSENAEELPAYRQLPTDKIEDVIGRLSGWSSFQESAKYSGSAIYFFRANPNNSIKRWLGTDDLGIVYIGRSGGMKGRSRGLAKNKHGVVRRMATLDWICEKKPIDRIQLQYAFAQVGKNEAPYWESVLLNSYYFEFGERPPMNRKHETSCFEHYGQKWDQITEWKRLIPMLQTKWGNQRT